MHEQLSVVDFDGDEAVAEAMAGLDEAADARRPAARRGSGGRRRRRGRAAAELAERPRTAASKANDIKILNYALTLEYLEAAFYAEALRVGGYSGVGARLRAGRRRP